MRVAVLPPRHRGVSLIEVMTAIAVFTILAVMAFPMYSTWIASQQVRTATESLVEGLRVAQSEALKRNADVRFVVDTAKGWEVQLASDDSVLKSAAFAEGFKEGIDGGRQLGFDFYVADLTGAVAGFQVVHFGAVGVEGVVVDKDRVALDRSRVGGAQSLGVGVHVADFFGDGSGII